MSPRKRPTAPAGARESTEQLKTIAGEEWASRAGEGGHDREREQAARDEPVARLNPLSRVIA